MSCYTFADPESSLLPHQLNVVKWFEKPTHNKLLAIHATGCGKTNTAQGVVTCYLMNNPDSVAVIVLPNASLMLQWASDYDTFMNQLELAEYTVEKETPASVRILLVTYNIFNSDNAGRLKQLRDRLTNIHKNKYIAVVDEVHKIQNDQTIKFEPTFELLKLAKKTLLMTATPFSNSESDVVSILKLIGIDWVSLFDKNGKFIKLQRFVSLIDDCCQGVTLERYQAKIEMTPTEESQFEISLKLEFVERTNNAKAKAKDSGRQSNPDAYYNITRQFQNAFKQNGVLVPTSKLQKALEYVQASDKCIIYTSFVEFGVGVFSKMLTNAKVKHGVIDGKISSSQRAAICDLYNLPNSHPLAIKAVVLTRAGATGLNFKRTRDLLILDPPWSIGEYIQLLGRVIRLGSHFDLPPSERHVSVTRMIYTRKSKKKGLTVDEKIYAILDRKDHEWVEVHETLRNYSIEKDNQTQNCTSVDKLIERYAKSSAASLLTRADAGDIPIIKIKPMNKKAQMELNKIK